MESEQLASLFSLITRGGWLMIPLIGCSLAALALIIERLIWGPRRSRVIPDEFSDEIVRLLELQKRDEALGRSRADRSPAGRIASTILSQSNRPREFILEATEIIGKKVALELQRYVGALGTIAAISPLIGLLGTVTGMITTFTAIGTHGVGNAPALASGISQALITTATGLTIAIPTFVFHRYFLQKSKRLTLELEDFASHILTLVKEDSSTSPSNSASS